MRILVAGDWHSELHEEAVFQAFRELGHDVHRFSWHEVFRPPGRSGPVSRFLGRVQNRLLTGPRLTRLNHSFVRRAIELDADLVFVYRGTHITADSLAAVKRHRPATVLVGYNNDDPFAPGHSRWLWRHFLHAVPRYDLVLAYRHSNVEDFAQAGARHVKLLRSWYFPQRNHPVVLDDSARARFQCDVTFVGHYEDDGRVALLEEVVRQGWKLRLHGPGYDWDPVIEKSEWLRSQVPVGLVWGEDYNRALCGAKIALCFLSKLNRDTYTRRCFEIPATGTFMLSEYTSDLITLFEPGKEADYFRDQAEFTSKLRSYLGDDERRRRVAQAGFERVRTDGHDVVSRMREVLHWTERLQAGHAP